MANPNLPEEILIEIFSRLPAKSVGRCRCLSKLWQKNLSNSQFINLHLSRQKTHQEEALLLIKYGRLLHTIASPIDDNTTSKHLSLLPQNWVQVLGSCDGLVLLLNDQRVLFVVNPILQQQVRVPHPPLPSHLKPYIMNLMYGFGYDISTDDYKILNLTTYYYGIDVNDVIDTLAHVYSLKKGAWRKVMCDFPHERFDLVAGAHVNGVIHWFTYGKEFTLASPQVLANFNLADEVFGVIPLPLPVDYDQIADYDRFDHNVSVFEGCLSLVSRVRLNDGADLWTMKEYGVQGSWTKMSLCTSGVESIKIKPLCFVGEKKLAVLDRKLLRLCDLETQKTKSMVVDGTKASFEDACVFFESLVSPNQLGVSR